MVVIASGSKGNCSYIETEKHKILIDLGISRRRIETNLLSHNSSLDLIDIILITHEHSDHTSGIANVLKKSNANLYISKGTYDAIIKSNNLLMKEALSAYQEKGKVHFLKHIENKAFYQKIEDFPDTIIEPIPLSHDALEPVGYVIKENDKKLTYITDTGYIHRAIYPIIMDSNCFILECNHDPEILMDSDRPYELKIRILSDHGHMSNMDAIYNLTKVAGINTSLVFYAHISDECNLFELIDKTRKKVFKDVGVSDKDINFLFTSQVPTEEYEI